MANDGWEETKIDIHMTAGKFRKMDGTFLENKRLIKELEEVQKSNKQLLSKYNKNVDWNADQLIKLEDQLRLMCLGIQTAITASDSGVTLVDAATALSLCAEAKEWLSAHSEQS